MKMFYVSQWQLFKVAELTFSQPADIPSFIPPIILYIWLQLKLGPSHTFCSANRPQGTMVYNFLQPLFTNCLW